MTPFQIVDEFQAILGRVGTADGLRAALDATKTAMGFDFVAMSHHVDICENRPIMVRLHDYPRAWEFQFDRQRLGRNDPVRRASCATLLGFAWTETGRLIELNAADRAVFAEARHHGIGEGFTVPAHVPGEPNGSVSFAMKTGRSLPHEMLAIAPLIAGHAFECGRRLWRKRPTPAPRPMLTPTQRECLKWVMRGKSDWETSQIMGCRPQTVVRHIKQARERYGVDKRTSLLIRALLDGTLNLADLDAA
jgi:LuxR family quorum-sensing system transcriptional regulator CciR